MIEIELQSAIEERNRARQDASESNLAQDEVVSILLSDLRRKKLLKKNSSSQGCPSS